MTGRWFLPGTPVSYTNKTDHHDIIEKVLKVALNILINPHPHIWSTYWLWMVYVSIYLYVTLTEYKFYSTLIQFILCENQQFAWADDT
jgi:hypothetical protein